MYGWDWGKGEAKKGQKSLNIGVQKCTVDCPWNVNKATPLNVYSKLGGTSQNHEDRLTSHKLLLESF